MKTVGIYEAKTNFSSLIEEVERGECVTITRHGKEVARIQRVEPRRRRPMSELREEFRRLRESQEPLGVPIKELVEEGRRF